jgi:serine/threonine protein kinase
MLCGHPPFYSSNQNKMLSDRVNRSVQMYDFFSTDAQSLLHGLLDRDPKKRISNSADIKKNPWFKKIDWKLLLEKKIKPPFKPTVTSPDDCRNIDQMFLRETIKETMPMMNMNSFNTRQQNHFEYFTYIGTTRQSTTGATQSSQGQGGPTMGQGTLGAGSKLKFSGISNPHQHHINVSSNTRVDEEEEGEDDNGSHAEMFVEIVQS